MSPSSVPRFVIKVVAWLPVAFAIWYFTAPALLWPVKLLLELVCGASVADLVRAVEQTGSVFTFATSLRPGIAGATGYVSLEVDGLQYSYGLPLFAALVLAAREPRWPRKLALGYAVLVPVMTWGVLADFLKNVAITSGPLVASQTGFSAPQREVIAFAYQFGTLILPTVAPAVAWVLMHRALLDRFRGHPASS
ncbi:MAG: hypothetical protein GZ089_09885 [Aromatoleum sp.]|nr:hypothetical protein [Aromatoleum sp.]